MTWRIALILALLFQVGLLMLVRYRTDLSPQQFLLTYWIAIGAAMLIVIALWRARND